MKRIFFIFLSLLFCKLSFCQIDLTNGLIAHYPFNGNANDESGNGNDGTVNGAVLTADRFGNTTRAYNFDGSNDFISIPNNAINDLPVGTVSAWVKLDNINGMYCIIDKTETYNVDYFQLKIQTDNKLSNLLNAGPGSTCDGVKLLSKLTFVPNIWYQVLITWDGNSEKCYINGTFDNSIETSCGIPDINRQPYIGRVDYGTEYMDGKIDDIYIYDRALTEPEILQLYANYYPPDTLTAKTGNRQATLTWDSTGWANMEKVYIYRDNSLIDSVLIDINSDTLYTDQNLVNGQSYAYFIRSKDNLGNISISSDTISVTPTIVPDGLVAYYPFNNNANDESGNGNDGTPNGVTITTDRFGNEDSAYSFDGTNSYIEITNNVDLENIKTISIWINNNESSSSNYFRFFLGKSSTSYYPSLGYHPNNNNIKFYDNSGIIVENDSININEWYYVVFILDGLNVKLYINNCLISSNLILDNPFNNSNDILIGGGISNRYFNGKIDDIRIYNRPLTELEIDSLYHQNSWGPVEIELAGTNTTNLGGNDGAIDLTVSWGVAPFTYSWSGGETTEDISNIAAGVYSVTVTDVRDSTVTDSIRIYDTFVDERDSTVYKAVRIGDQMWMAENLNVGSYIESINTGSGHSDVYDNGVIEKYCYNNNEAYCDTFGGLYDWNEMMQYITIEGTQGVCPMNWHIPSDKEWKTLEIYLGMSQIEVDGTDYRGTDEGGKLKEIGTSHWNPPNTGATNESGFTGIPIGYRSYLGHFGGLREGAFFWSATEYTSPDASWRRVLGYNISGVERNSNFKPAGFSVRCVLDSLSISLKSCNTSSLGGSDGSIDLILLGGIPPYNYSWSNGATTQDISVLTAGVYSVTVTDAIGTSVTDSIRIYDTFMDERDSTVYKAVRIGDQMWMAENLNIGERINGGVDQTINSTVEKYCYGNNETNCDIYGGLYQWDEIMQNNPSDNGMVGTVQGICPVNWHLPTDVEWNTLVNYLGGNSIAGEKIKETGIVHWNSPNTGTNESGFTALPAGHWSTPYYNSFLSIGRFTLYWSATDTNSADAWARYLYNDISDVYRNQYNKMQGASVRCIFDTLSISLKSTETTSLGGSDGSIDLILLGGIPPYNYSWSNGTTIEDISGLTAGVYSVTVTDAIGTSVTDSIRIYDTFVDERDSTVYKIIVIGGQIWMAENLNVGKRIIGGLEQKNNDTIEYYCYDDNEAYCDTFGGLYQWDEMMQYTDIEEVKGVCPDGWHLPGDEEWKTLELELGMSESVIDNTGWRGTDQGAQLKINGSSGFEGLLSGFRNTSATFLDIYIDGNFWTSSNSDTDLAYNRALRSSQSNIARGPTYKNSGFSVRCVKNSGPLEIELSPTHTDSIGASNGTIDLTIPNGIPPYFIIWSNGKTSEDLDSLFAGIYFVTVTDARDSTAADTVRIYDTFMDTRDNTRYKAVTIGQQTWMAENLNTGDRINGVSDQTDNGSIEKYCYNDNEAYCDTFGGSYQWDEMMQYADIEEVKGVCPDGWHLPSDEEWKTLELELGMSESIIDNTSWRGTDQGTQLKINGNSGFEGLLAGLRNTAATFLALNIDGNFWTSTNSNINLAYNRALRSSQSNIARRATYKNSGFSVRCIKDSSTFYLAVTPSSLAVSSEADSKTFVVSSNVNWSITADAKWLTINKINATTISVNIDKNESANSRTTTFYVFGTAVDTQTVTITQEGIRPIENLIVTPAYWTTNSDTDSITFTVQFDTSWTVTYSTDWLSITKIDSTSFSVTINENTTTSPRTAIISVSGTGVAIHVTITQDGVISDIRIFSIDKLEYFNEDTICISSESGQFNLCIESNENWDIDYSSHWFNVEKINDTLVSIIYDNNRSYSSRRAIINFASSQNVTKSIILKQEGEEYVNSIKKNHLNNINIYPNPTGNKVFIDFGINPLDNVSVFIVNTTGELIVQKEYMNIRKGSIIEIDLDEFSNGIYYVKILLDNDIVRIVKILKQ